MLYVGFKSCYIDDILLELLRMCALSVFACTAGKNGGTSAGNSKQPGLIRVNIILRCSSRKQGIDVSIASIAVLC